jgi:polyhydroxybutyrate depolymerase
MKIKFYYLFLLLGSSLFLEAQTLTNSFVYDTISREYVIHIPASYDAAEALPLLISLHGLGDNMTNFSGAGFHALSESENFIVVTPQALNFNFSGFAIGTSWNSGVGAQISILSTSIYPNEAIDDVGFISALIDSISLLYNIDVERIYATGFSMGGFMTNRLGIELNEKIAAIASVSGTMGDNYNRSNACPIPAMHIHGTADATIDYNADYSNAGGLYTITGDSVSGLTNFWNSVNQTDESPLYNANYASSGGLTFEEFIWENGRNSSVTRHLKVNGGEHVWNTSFYPSEIWNFLSVHKNQDPCVIIGLNEPDSRENFSIYPNPSTDKVYLSAATPIQHVSLFNALGQKVLESKEALINISGLSNGVYYVLIQTSESILKSKLTKK